MLFLLAPLVSPIAAAETDGQFWSIFTAAGSFDKKAPFRWQLEAQPRLGDNMQKLERLLLRPAVGYVLKPGISLWAGYAWAPLFINADMEHQFVDEHRIWQQLSIERSISGFDLNHRIRLEQRDIHGVEDLSHRLRYLLRVSKELGSLNSKCSYGVTGYNEIFFNLNQTNGPERGFDRNRIFLGAYLNDQDVRYEMGYLNEYSTRRNREDRMISAFLVSVGIQF
jgi:hypothetical protein